MGSKYLLPLALAVAAMSACGDDTTDDVGDGGARDGSVANTDGGLDSGQSGALQPGLYAYSNIRMQEDGCEIGLEDPEFPPEPIPLGNTGTNISLGTLRNSTTDPTFTPSGYALGSGPYSTPTMATLTVNARAEGSDGCDFNVQRTTVITYTGNNMVSVSYTDRQTNHTAECDLSDCTSRYTFNLSRTDGGL